MAPDGPSARLPAGLSRPLWRCLFFGPARLRAGWRVLLFILLVMGIGALVRLAYDRLGIRLGRDWTPITFLVQEPLTLLISLAATAVMSRIDRLPLAVFGITWRNALRGRFWEGSLWGFAAVAVLVGVIALGGGYHVRGFALHGAEL